MLRHADTPPSRGASPHSDSGFSLIEIVLAMFILALMSIGLLPLLVTAAGGSAQNREQVSADSLAAAEIAALRQMFRDDLENSCTDIEDAAELRSTTTLADPTTGYFPKIIVGGCPSTLPDVIQIEVEIHPTVARTQALTTVITQLLVAAT